jgi:phenylacetate-CoA ligase
MNLYAPFYRVALFPLWERLRHRPTLSRLHYLSRTQYRSTDELVALQVAKLRQLLTHAAAQVPAYRARIADSGIDPGRLRDPADLGTLPLVSRQEVQRDPVAFTAADKGGPLLTKSTSGTTGNPFRFSYSQDSEVWRQAVKLRAYGWAGYSPGMTTLHYWGPPAVQPMGRKAIKIALDRGLRRETYLDCARQGVSDLQQVVKTIRRLRPQVLVGFTQATVELGRFVLSGGLRDWPAMQVICGAERLFEKDRQVLELAFGATGTVFETYGCREFMLIASECEAHDGLHQSMENLLVEIVDDQGHAAPPGTLGQVAITDLHNFGMPLIRYLTGDLAIARGGTDGTRCACGRGLSRLSSLEGRQSDLLRGSDGRGIPGLVFNSVFASLGGQVEQFQAVQRKDGRIDLKVVPGPEWTDQVVEGLTARLRPYLGELPLSVKVVQSIPSLPSGKRRYVVIEDAQGAL